MITGSPEIAQKSISTDKFNIVVISRKKKPVQLNNKILETPALYIQQKVTLAQILNSIDYKKYLDYSALNGHPV